MSQIKDAKTLIEASCADDYDPNSMPVDQARNLIRQFLSPISGVLRLPIRSTLGHILAEDIVSPVNVPAHRNSAMDGWAIRFADVKSDGETVLTEIGASFAGKPFGEAVMAGECVRIMTGGVVPEGADCVVMQERAKANGKQIAIAPAQKLGQNLRHAGEDLKAGAIALPKGQPMRPAELGLDCLAWHWRSRRFIGHCGSHFSPPATNCARSAQPLGEGQIYDSNRYTIYGMLTRTRLRGASTWALSRDDPTLLEKALPKQRQIADVVITSGGVSVGEADFVKQMLNKLGEVVFWKIAMKPGRPLAYGKIGNAHFFGLPGNPVSVMVTFYQFVRDASVGVDGPRPSIDPFPR